MFLWKKVVIYGVSWFVSIAALTTGIVFAVKTNHRADEYGARIEQPLQKTSPVSYDAANNTETYVFEHPNLPSGGFSNSDLWATENDRVQLKTLLIDNQDDNSKEYDGNGGANGIFLHMKSNNLPAQHFVEDDWNHAGIIRNYKQYTNIKISFSLYSALDVSDAPKASGGSLVHLANTIRSNKEFLQFPQLTAEAIYNSTQSQKATATKYNEFTLEINKQSNGDYLFENAFGGKNQIDMQKELIVDSTLPKKFNNINSGTKKIEDVTFWQNLDHTNKSMIGIYARPVSSLKMTEPNTKAWNDYYLGLNKNHEDNLVIGMLPSYINSSLSEDGVSALIKNMKVELTRPRT